MVKTKKINQKQVGPTQHNMFEPHNPNRKMNEEEFLEFRRNHNNHNHLSKKKNHIEKKGF